jgi:hypothetical protein
MSPFPDYIPADIADLFEIHEYHHAATISLGILKTRSNEQSISLALV